MCIVIKSKKPNKILFLKSLKVILMHEGTFHKTTLTLSSVIHRSFKDFLNPQKYIKIFHPK